MMPHDPTPRQGPLPDGPERTLALLSHWAGHLKEHAAELAGLRQTIGPVDGDVADALREAEDSMVAAGASLANAAAELRRRTEGR